MSVTVPDHAPAGPGIPKDWYRLRPNKAGQPYRMCQVGDKWREPYSTGGWYGIANPTAQPIYPGGGTIYIRRKAGTKPTPVTYVSLREIGNMLDRTKVQS